MRRFIAAAVALSAFVVAGPAGAATWQVYLGEQAKPPAGTPKGATLNIFLPATLQIHAGDKVKFTSASFHTASYLGGTTLGPPFIGDPAKAVYSGINDSTGAAFFFDSLPKLIYNVSVFGPAGGTKVPGKGLVSTGILSPGPNGKPVSATLAFPKVGTFKMLCTIHPGMTMTVAVRAAGASVPDAATVKAAATAQTAAAWAKAPALAKAKTPVNTVYVGNGGKTTLLAMVPLKLTVKAGTTVNFINKSPSEPHNVGFGPKAYILAQLKKLDLFPFAPGAPNQAPPYFVYGSEPPGGYVYDGTNHGNGFLATPLSDAQPGSPPRGLAGSYRIKFTKAGKYHYFCMLHGPDMAGDIVVTP
jgi:plastocyanin